MSVSLAPPESVVLQIWERQMFLASGPAALGFTVVYRGLPSDAGGPDYRDALLADGAGNLIRGDIEFHSRSSDWYRHGHHSNPGYNSVVLHVVWADDAGETRTHAGHLVPCLQLRDIAAVSDVRSRPLAPHACAARLAALGERRIRRRIAELGTARLVARSDRIAEEVAAVGAEQTLYANLLEALGFAGNREGFRMLADAVPFAILVEQPPSLRTDFLLAAAGFAASGSAHPPVRLATDSWRLARLRPQNQPARRIGAVAPLVARLLPDPSQTVLDTVSGSAAIRRLIGLVSVLDHGDSLIGSGRAREMTASVLLPYAHALGATGRSLDLLHECPPPPATRWTRAFLDLLPARFPVRNAAEHQGIHALFTGHCRWERESGCPVCLDGPGRAV